MASHLILAHILQNRDGGDGGRAVHASEAGGCAESPAAERLEAMVSPPEKRNDAPQETPLEKSQSELTDKTRQIRKLMDQLSQLRAGSVDATTQDAPKEHKFWRTQPVVRDDNVEADALDGSIEGNKSVEQVRGDPYPLPSDFQWCQVDIEEPTQRRELYELLNSNYVEDIESLFRFDYPEHFLEWALKAPGWVPEWNVGVRVTETGKLVAFISAIPAVMQVRDNQLDSVEVNFLCIHKRLRSKRLAPLMIREITRRVNRHGIFQALYTAGAALPGVISKARYYHRPLDYKKLVEVGFTAVPLGKSVENMVLKYHLAREHQLGPSLRPMTGDDVPQVKSLLEQYLKRFQLHMHYGEGDVAHWLLPRTNILYTFVVEENNGKITDFVSFYSLPSTVVNNTLHSRINVAYLFYYAASSPAQLQRIIHAALVIARDLGFDVFNCVEIMENGLFLKDLKFGEGDGYLHYYLYNWKTKPLDPKDTAIVML